MSTSTILILTVLLLVLILAVALLTGSLALLVGGPREDDRDHGGLVAALRLLDRQWQIERLIYRHHRIVGGIVLATGIFCVWRLASTDLLVLLNGSSATSALTWTLLLGQGFNLVVGMIILLRPSLLKPLESLSNRWHGLDTGQPHRPRAMLATAVVLSLVGLLVLMVSAMLILHQISGLMA